MADIRVLSRLLKRKQQLDLDLWRVAKSMLIPEMKVQYKIGHRQYWGRVVGLTWAPGRHPIRVRLENVVTLKQRNILLSDIVGFQEH